MSLSSFFPLASSLFAQDDWSLNNQLFFVAEWVFMRRAEIHNHNIVDKSRYTPESTIANFETLNTRTLVNGFEMESGYRLGLSYMMDEKSTFEASYLDVGEWRAEDKVHGDGSLSFPFSTSYDYDFTYADKVKVRYKSKFYNAELNYWRNVTPRRVDYFAFAWIAGLRYINLTEHFNLAFTKELDTSNYKIRTVNHLSGLQLGLDFQMNPTRNLSWDFALKVGVLLDYVKEEAFLGDYNNTVTLRDFQDHKYVSTFLTDVRIDFAYQCASHLNFHGGYQMIYLTGLALAPEQLDKSVSNNSGKYLYAKGESIVHGLFLGGTLGF